MEEQHHEPLRGYIEGYYGRLLRWADRHRLLGALAERGLNCYFYAPKEDTRHRLHWREPYSRDWRDKFSAFCDAARRKEITVLVGIAPGLDFDFNHMDAGSDLQTLVTKARTHLADGAAHVVLCMDDIDEDFDTRCGSFLSEGEAHAELANTLSVSLGNPVFVVPRVYANEIAVTSPTYPLAFAQTINSTSPVVLCGSDIVAKTVRPEDFHLYSDHMTNRIVTWDNLYANDYCPRRLYVGPWHGREAVSDVLLNPTGYIETDLLLLALMAESLKIEGQEAAWQTVMSSFQVPEQFAQVSQFFRHPPFQGDENARLVVTDDMFAALEFLLWKWKTPLSREWYPYFMQLKQDLLLYTDELPEERIVKTQTVPMAMKLTRR